MSETDFLTPLRRPTWKSGRTHWTPNWRQRWQRSSFWARPFSHLILERRHTRQAAARRLFWSRGESRTPSGAGAGALSDRSITSASICARTRTRRVWLSAAQESPPFDLCRSLLRGALRRVLGQTRAAVNNGWGKVGASRTADGGLLAAESRGMGSSQGSLSSPEDGWGTLAQTRTPAETTRTKHRGRRRCSPCGQLWWLCRGLTAHSASQLPLDQGCIPHPRFQTLQVRILTRKPAPCPPLRRGDLAVRP